MSPSGSGAETVRKSGGSVRSDAPAAYGRVEVSSRMPASGDRPSSPSVPLAPTRAEFVAAELERERIRRRDRWTLILIGLAVSVPLHAAIAIWLMSILLARPGPIGAGEVTFELAVLPTPALEESATSEMPDAAAPAVETAVETIDANALSSIEPQAATERLGTGALEAGGSGAAGEAGAPAGGAGGLGPGGGGGGTSFFGIGGRGQRFAYIVDVSGSMSTGERLPTAIHELKRSIAALPDFASVYVCLFHTVPVPQPFANGWVRARPANVARYAQWLDQQRPQGGTEPRPAFEASFILSPPPDVIFFLTDGEIPEQTADLVAQLNAKQKRKVTVHAIAFSSDAGQEQLRRIARESEGTFRFVPVGSPRGLLP